VTYFTVLVLSVATLWMAYQMLRRSQGVPAHARASLKGASSLNRHTEVTDDDIASRLRLVAEEAKDVEEPEATEELEEEAGREEEPEDEEPEPEADSPKPKVKRQPPKDSPKMAATKMQLERLLAVPVPVILSKQALQSKNEFSCGGTHVVKLNAYADLKKLKHVEEVLPDMDMFYASRNDKIFDRCAVVGNSGSMLEVEHGMDIDAHDVVVRFNSGITEGYEQFVGSKTTFRILNNPDSGAKEKGEITISTLRDDDIKVWAVGVLTHPERAEGSALCFDQEFLCYAWQWVRNTGHKPSTGLVGLVMALKVCRKVSIYGFQSSNYFSKTERPHYYDWERPAKGRERVHPFAREVALYKVLNATGFITMVTP